MFPTSRDKFDSIRSVPSRFRAIARERHDRAAVRCSEVTLSYEELDRHSDALAAVLLREGVEPGAPVAFSAERRVETVVTLLAILKAGGFYVPLDTSQPAERLATILEDSGAALVVGENANDLPGELTRLPFPDLGKTAEGLPALDPLGDDPESPAYLFYTSGTTGRPKGVLVPHRAILRLVVGADYADFGSDQVFLHHSPVAFDASTFEIWGPLLNGGELVIHSEEHVSLRGLDEAIEEFGITTLWLTAGLFHALVDERIESLAPIRQLLAGGDVLSPARIERVLATFPDLALINGYGPTENTTFTTCHRLRPEDVAHGRPAPIGRPIAGTEVHILDESGRLVADGEVGELHASGAGLALGYWNRPERTAECFVRATWNPDLRLYRSGDLVRRDDDGVLHFEGRRDGQVKIRGFRIELSGIEAALESHPAVEKAAVVAQERRDRSDKELVAWLVPTKRFPENEAPASIDQDSLRSHLALSMSAAEMPVAFRSLPEIPLTANGKVDRSRLVSLASDPFDSADTGESGPNTTLPGPPAESPSVLATVLGILGRRCGPTPPSLDENFFDLGLTSLDIARVHEQLERALEIEFAVTELFEHTTAATLADRLESIGSGERVTVVERRKGNAAPDDAIAIVGMAGRFPGAPDVDTFWENLLAGRETISHFREDELDFENAGRDGSDSTWIRARGIVDGSDLFDARHFGIPPREAERLDPQHRLLLECAQHALEDAGHDPDRFGGKIGIFSGSSQNSYLLNNLCADRDFVRRLAAGYPVNDFAVLFGNDKDFLPTRIAYKLNLRGPAIAVQCACSTSLVAVTQACESLRSGTSDLALAGGVSLTFPQKRDYLYTPEGMASGDGHCRTFDADATGTVFGEGVGLVVLRRLADALADGDSIVAVVRGFAVNNDGSDKIGYAAPSVAGQVAVIREALHNAGAPSRSIGYVEAHGTGTPLGDPIEVAALARAFREDTADVGFCGIGTAKTNVGHLDIAAGVTGLIKTALTVKHGVMPPLVHYRKPNPKIDFDSSAFYPVTGAKPWPSDGSIRRAGVSALGVGGTNAHVVLEEAPPAKPGAEPDGSIEAPRFFPLSASCPEALEDSIRQLGRFAADPGETSLDDVAFTLQEGRRRFDHRVVLTARSFEELADKCGATERPRTERTHPDFRRIAFLFPGQGAQHPGMAREVYENEPVFRETFDRCSDILEPELGLSLIDLVRSPDADRGSVAEQLQDTSLAQPAIFATSYSLARLWRHRGIIPDRLLGHSIGEFAAACFAGVFDLEDALPLIALRGRLMSDLPGGVMISVRAAVEDLDPFLDGDFDLAAINGPAACVLAGPNEGAEELERRLAEADLVARRLHTSHAFHSRMMDKVVPRFEEAVAGIRLRAPEIEIVSTVEPGLLEPRLATDPAYWAAHLRRTVRFHESLSLLAEKPDIGFLEVGPGNTLATLAGGITAHARGRGQRPAFSSLPHPGQPVDAHEHLLSTAGKLWAKGLELDWSELEERTGAPRRVRLPLYPFQRERFWIEPPAESDAPADAARLPSPAEVVAPGKAAPTEAPTGTAPEPIALENRVAEIFAEISGFPVESLASDATFLELGLDSLLLTQASHELRDHFGVEISLRELIDSHPTIERLAAHVEATGAKSTPAARPVPSRSPSRSVTDRNSNPDRNTNSDSVAQEKRDAPISFPVPGAKKTSAKSVSELTSRQRRHIEDLVSRYTRKTATSKELTAKHRRHHADPRTASGFHRAWKEMVYQIVTERSRGSRLLDVDGNEYIDILNGFGPGFLGHSPEFLLEAIDDQLHRGFEIGPNHRVAIEAAELFCEVTGNERTSFVCTGSEAVQASMRLARTVTGRDKIVIFARDYHGNFDEVLVRGIDGPSGRRSLPVAPGIPKRAAEDMIVLPYGTDESLSVIREQADRIAAVIVEPVQSRRPDFRPREFIREVRAITREAGALFVFDEVVTGFRFGPGGAQDYYGVDADLATYGKVVGGGMPVGVVSGKAEFMDTFDGGPWNYGDESFPEKPVTFFAGTFVRHPLAMAGVRAMLSFLRDQPPHFWDAINDRGDRLAGAIDSFFVDEGIPCRMPNCGSLMYVRMGDDQPHGNLLFYHLREKGVFLLEGFPSYLTAAHRDEDIDYVVEAFRESARELQEAGFFPAEEPNEFSGAKLTGPPACLARDEEPPPPDFSAPILVPTTEPQREIVVASALGDTASRAFNESASLHFEGPIDRDALETALSELVERHDSLRADFSPDGREMRIRRDREIDLVVVAAGNGESGSTTPGKVPDGERILGEVLHREASTAFDLANGPLVRLFLVDRGPERATLVITAHHAICDGWSFNVIAEELSDRYRAIAAPESVEPFQRHETPKAFAEFSREQVRFRGSAEYGRQRNYWLEQFEDLPAPIELPLDRPYPAERSFQGGTVSREIGADVHRAIKTAGAKQGSTLYATLSAVFALLLHRLTGQEEIIYAIPAAGQNEGDRNENLVGHCVNFLPLRSRLPDKSSVAGLLASSRATLLEATDHRSYTYGELLRDLRIPRDPRRMPLAEVAFNLERMDYFGDWPELDCLFVPNPKTNVHYTLFVNVVESDDGLRIDADYNADVLDRGTVERWMEHFETLVRRLGESAGELDSLDAAGIPLLSEELRRTILESWSGADAIDPASLPTIPERFARVAAEHPDAIALEAENRSTTYRELDVLSDRAAARLHELGIRPGDPVAVLAERSPELVVSLLGILKAGGAYVPIDPSYPCERIEGILTDSGAKVLVGDRPLPEAIGASAYHDRTRICIDELLVDHEGETPETRIGVDDPAYLIFTSGSTGRPKGIRIPHRGITRLVCETDYIRFGPEETFLLSSPISFDASTLELWGPLLHGGKLALLPPGVPGLDEIGEAIARHGVTTLWLTSGLFQLMVDERPQHLSSLRQLLVGGDIVSPDHARRALAVLAPHGRLYNGYGPTENTTFTTVHPITEADTERTSLPIGRPIRNTSVHLLDASGNPVPPGVKGRLFIGGAGLAIGYLDRPDLDAEKFRPDPFSDRPGARLYDSGDYARWRPGGTIEFLGRDDDQVKIRGFRIELGEIEAALAGHPSVSRAAVIALGNDAENKRLVGFVLADTGDEANPAELLDHVRASLPAYMIPNRIEVLDKFPVTANGKVDYPALAHSAATTGEDSTSPPATAQHHDPPRTAIEERMARLWSEILGVEQIGREDDFFDLGGHSLSGLRLFTRIEQELGIVLPLATLFQSRTVTTLSVHIERHLAPDNGDSPRILTRIQEGDPKEVPLFLVHGGDGGTLFYRKFADSVGYPGAIYTVESPHLLDSDPAPEIGSIAETAARYLGEIARTIGSRRFQLGGYSYGGAVAYEIACQAERAGRNVDLLHLFDTPNPARESDFSRRLPERIRHVWNDTDPSPITNRIREMLRWSAEGVISKIRYYLGLARIRFVPAGPDDSDSIRTQRLQRRHRLQMAASEPSVYGGLVVLYRAETEPEAFDFPEKMGWEPLVSKIVIVPVPGCHESIFNDENAATLARRFRKTLSVPSRPEMPLSS